MLRAVRLLNRRSIRPVTFNRRDIERHTKLFKRLISNTTSFSTAYTTRHLKSVRTPSQRTAIPSIPTTQTRKMALTRSTDPLVWIDCEMTGLNPETDSILSIACIITTSDLHPLDPGFDAIIFTPSQTLSSMSPWCITTHAATGLTSACLASTTTAETAASELLSYIQRFCPEKGMALLAGNSVHVDKLFLMRGPWAPVVEWLHYRILDVSAVKEGVRRWCGEGVLERVPVKKGRHEARGDVEESIEEARFYMQLLRGVR